MFQSCVIVKIRTYSLKVERRLIENHSTQVVQRQRGRRKMQWHNSKNSVTCDCETVARFPIFRCSLIIMSFYFRFDGDFYASRKFFHRDSAAIVGFFVYMFFSIWSGVVMIQKLIESFKLNLIIIYYCVNYDIFTQGSQMTTYKTTYIIYVRNSSYRKIFLDF